MVPIGGERCARGISLGMGHGIAGGATYHRDEDLVTGGDAHGEALAVLVKGTGANSEDLSLVLLLDTALREEDAGGSLSLGLDALDQDAVEEGSKALDVAKDRLLRRESVSSVSRWSGCILIGCERKSGGKGGGNTSLARQCVASLVLC